VSIVVDANVVVAAGAATPRGAAARQRLARWSADTEDLHVPNLFVYEVASALSGLEAEELMTPGAIGDIWRLVDALDLTFHPPSSGTALMAIARRLHERSAYDAAYIDLALQLTAELWTLDGKLARNAASVGFPVTLLV
jgi:predicted nucleic acid-binding protein